MNRRRNTWHYRPLSMINATCVTTRILRQWPGFYNCCMALRWAEDHPKRPISSWLLRPRVNTIQQSLTFCIQQQHSHCFMATIALCYSIIVGRHLHIYNFNVKTCLFIYSTCQCQYYLIYSAVIRRPRRRWLGHQNLHLPALACLLFLISRVLRCHNEWYCNHRHFIIFNFIRH